MGALSDRSAVLERDDIGAVVLKTLERGLFALAVVVDDDGDLAWGTKQVWHPTVGCIALEHSAFAVDGQPDLGMVVFSPATPADAGRIRSLLEIASSVTR